MAYVNFHDAPLDVPVWCVYGPDCFPTMFCAKLNMASGSRAIWGYSIYRRKAGFRTLGQGVAWAEDNNLKIFLTQEEALQYLAVLTTPKAGAI